MTDHDQITHGEWRCVEEPEDDSDGFSTPSWHAVHRRTGERRSIHHSRFRFHMTPERFAWLVDNDFPSSRVVGANLWSDEAIDRAMKGETE